jgi:regulator of sigma E protease
LPGDGAPRNDLYTDPHADAEDAAGSTQRPPAGPPPEALKPVRYVYAILALGLLIAFHELGHLVLARLFGIRVDKFSVGFGPPMISFKRRTTEWVIGAFPLGGYVIVHGMNPHAEGDLRADRASFASRSAWVRALVLAAGSLFNLLLAVAVLVGLFVHGTHVPVSRTVGSVQPGSEAARVQLRPGDQVVAVDGEPIGRWSELVGLVARSPGQPLELTLVRAEGPEQLTVVPRDEGGVGRLGVTQQYVFRQHSLQVAVGLAIDHVARLVNEGGRLLVRLLRGERGVDLESPIGLVKHASDAAALGWDAFFRVLVAISVALALFNLLPLPALDGGRILFVLIEGVSGRRLNPKLETLLHTAGFLLLVVLVLFVAARDLRHLWQQPPDPVADPPGVGLGLDAGSEAP